MCRNLNVSKAGYYAWRGRKPSARARADEALKLRIRAIHLENKGRYGSPRIHAELQSVGMCVARKRVARLMRSANLKAKKRRHFRVTTVSSHSYPTATNLLARDFKPALPNRAWAADITYFATREGWLYLAVVIDLFSRRVVGWSMSTRIDTALVLDALQMALRARKPEKGLIVHTDRGSQYACREYQSLLQANGIIASMSRKGDCWDNAVAESFFATLKVELKDKSLWATRSEARSAIFEYIEIWYNRRRRHSTIGYISPLEFEKCQRVA
jgi:transposase InsO family protein